MTIGLDGATGHCSFSLEGSSDVVELLPCVPPPPPSPDGTRNGCFPKQGESQAMGTFWDFFEGTLSGAVVELDIPPGHTSRHPTLGLS